MNRLLPPTEHAQKSTMLFLDSHRTVESLPLTSMVTTREEFSPQKKSASRPDGQDGVCTRQDGVCTRQDGVCDEMPLRLMSNGLKQTDNSDQLDVQRAGELRPTTGIGQCSEGRSQNDFSEVESSVADGEEVSMERLSSMDMSCEDTCTLGFTQVDACDSIALIDEDDDDVSLRERTVTDVSFAEGNAAELVCGRIASISLASSHSICERWGNSLATTPLPEEEEEPCDKPTPSCCTCIVL